MIYLLKYQCSGLTSEIYEASYGLFIRMEESLMIKTP